MDAKIETKFHFEPIFKGEWPLVTKFKTIQEHLNPIPVKLEGSIKDSQCTITFQRCELVSTIHKSNVVKISTLTDQCLHFKALFDDCLREIASY